MQAAYACGSRITRAASEEGTGREHSSLNGRTMVTSPTSLVYTACAGLPCQTGGLRQTAIQSLMPPAEASWCPARTRHKAGKTFMFRRRPLCMADMMKLSAWSSRC